MCVPRHAAADNASLHCVGRSSGRPQGQPFDSWGQVSDFSMLFTIFTSLCNAFSCSAYDGGLGIFFMYSSVIFFTSDVTAEKLINMFPSLIAIVLCMKKKNF